MNTTQLDWYLEAIKHEIEQINGHDFVGNIAFKMNIKHGVIGNMNIDLSKSVRDPDVVVIKTVSHI